MIKKKILGVILARGGSKRLKNKNIRILKSIPLIKWSINSALKSKVFCDVILSSDSKSILKIAGKKVLKLSRPKKISKDISKSEISLIHSVKRYEKKYQKIHYVALMQPTSPFRTIKTIKNSIKKLIKNRFDILVAVKKTNNINNKKFYIRNYDFCIESNNYSIKNKYQISGVFYLVKKNYLFKYKNLSPKKFIHYIIKSKKENIDIDTKKDFNLAKRFIN